MSRPFETTKFSCLVAVLDPFRWIDSSDFENEGRLPPLVVPDFQRLYEWPEEMVANFTTNLFDTFKRNNIDGEKNFVFASTVFLHLHQHEPNVSPYKDSRYRAYILDGQQRLVTLSLIILALMDRLSKEKPTVPGEDDYNDMVVQLHDRLFFKLNSIKVPRIALHPSQNDIWESFLATEDGREKFIISSEEKAGNVFPSNYVAICTALDECLSGSTRLSRSKELYDFSNSLLKGLCKSVRLVRHGSLQLSLKMLSGINTPGRPLDAVSHIKFHLATKRVDEDQEEFRDFVAKLDSSTPTSVVVVAACAILPNVKTATEVITDDLTIVMDALKVFEKSGSDIPNISFFGVEGVKGLNAEEAYWSRAIPVSQYLEQMDAYSDVKVDRCIMPLLALSRIKSSKTSTSGKTLRLIQSLLVAAILSFGGKVMKNNGSLHISNSDGLCSYFELLVPKLLYILTMKPSKGTREVNVQELIEKQLKIFKNHGKKDASKDLLLEPANILELLKTLHNRSTPPKNLEDMIEAGLNFAVLLSCQPPETAYNPNRQKWRFDGLHDFQLEHVASQSPKSRKEIPLSLIHCLGNYCLIEPEKNSSAGNKPFFDKKLVYKDSAFYVPWKLSESADVDFLAPQICKRHKELLNKLYYLLMPKGSDPPGKTFDLPLTAAETENDFDDRDSSNIAPFCVQQKPDLKALLDDQSIGSLVRTFFPKGCRASPSSVSRQEFEAVFHVRKFMNGKRKHHILASPVEDVAVIAQKEKYPLATKWIASQTFCNWKKETSEWWKKQGGTFDEETSFLIGTQSPNPSNRNQSNAEPPQAQPRHHPPSHSPASLTAVSPFNDNSLAADEREGRRKRKQNNDDSLADFSSELRDEGQGSVKKPKRTHERQTLSELMKERDALIIEFFKNLNSEELLNDRIHTVSEGIHKQYARLVKLEGKISKLDEFADLESSFKLTGRRGFLSEGKVVYRRVGKEIYAYSIVRAELRETNGKLSVQYKIEKPDINDVEPGALCRDEMHDLIESMKLFITLEEAKRSK